MSTQTILPPALSTSQEEEEHPCKLSNAPKLSFSQAMNRFFLTEQGEAVSVSSCSAQEFSAFIHGCLKSERRKDRKAARQECMEELEGLDFDEIGRWYALDTLKLYRIPLLLYGTMQEAEQSQQ